jgi:hypothetical protein
MSATPTAEPAAKARRRRILRIAQVAFSVAIVVAIFAYAIPKFASYGAVWAVLQRLTGAQLGLLVAVTVFNLVTYWLQLMAALPGLTLVRPRSTTRPPPPSPTPSRWWGVPCRSASPTGCLAPGGSAWPRSP